MKKVQFIFFFLSFIFEIGVMAQPPSIEWAKCLGGTDGDWGYDCIQVRDGGFMFCGQTLSDNGDVIGNHSLSSDAWLIKTDSAGIIQWSKCYGGTGDESANSIKQTPDGGFIFAGFASSTDGDVTGLHVNSSFADYWLVKIDSIGNIQWQKCFGGSAEDRAVDLILSNDGGYAATGNSNSHDGDVTGNHNNDHWVVKLDSVGNLQWQKALGSYAWELTNGILSSGSGFVEIGGASENSGDVTGLHDSISAFADAWLVNLDSTGNIIWEKCYGGSLGDGAIGGINLSNGTLLIGGWTSSNDGDISGLNGSANALLLKINSLGDIIFQKCYGQYFEIASGIAPTNDGGVVMAGLTNSNSCGFGGMDDFWIVKADSMGNMQWSKCLGGYRGENAEAIQQTNEGGFIVIGSTTSPNGGDVFGLHSNITEDFWVVKLSPEPTGILTPSSPLTDFSARFDISGSLQLNFYANGNEKIEMSVLDLTGREIFKKSLSVNNGFNDVETYPGKLSSGLYFVAIVVNGSTIVKKVYGDFE